MLDRIKSALTRKIGPFPAWGWLTIILVAVYWYRHHTSSTTTAATATTDTSTPATPQDPVTLQPGESVYDPNTGGLVTAPGGGSGSGDNSTSTGGGDTSGTSAGGGDTASALPGIFPPGTKITLPFTRVRGATKKKAKPKDASKAAKSTGKGAGKLLGKGDAKGRPRSGTGIKGQGRTVKSGNRGTPKGTRRTVSVKPSSAVRQRQLTPMTRAVTRQRPVASSVKPPATEHPANPPRPSAPPKRTVRRGK